MQADALSSPAQSISESSLVQSIIHLCSQVFAGFTNSTVSVDGHRLQLRPGPPKVHHHLPDLGGVEVQMVGVGPLFKKT